MSDEGLWDASWAQLHKLFLDRSLGTGAKESLVVKLDGLLSAVQLGGVTEIRALFIHKDPLAEFQKVVPRLPRLYIQTPRFADGWVTGHLVGSVRPESVFQHPRHRMLPGWGI